MKTSIGVVIEVKQILWIVENPLYPAEERYIGELETKTGQDLNFVSDISVPTDKDGWRAVGRMDLNKPTVEIADHSHRTNDAI